MKTKCSIIEDMIPLYKEGLCSDDTAEMVKEHIAECANCCKLCEDIREEKAENSEIPDESKVFHKVSKKMKRSKLKIAVLSIILICMLGGLGFLTFGQITHMEGCISFDTMIQSFETYRITKLIAKGDMDSYADSISSENNFNANFNILRNYDDIKEQNRKALNEAYDKYMKNKEVKMVRSFGQYSHLFSAASTSEIGCSVVNYATIEYKDGTALEMQFVKSYDGKYICIDAINLTAGDTDTWKFGNVILYANNQKFFPDGLADVLFKKYDKEYFEKYPDKNTFMMRNWFVEEEQDNINKGFLSYYRDNGYTIENFISSELRFDEEKSKVYYDFFFKGRDEKGTAFMTAKVYSTPDGLIPPAKEDIEIIPNGCTDGLVEGMRNFFGNDRNISDKNNLS